MTADTKLLTAVALGSALICGLVVWLSYFGGQHAVLVFIAASAMQILCGFYVVTRFQRSGRVIPLLYIIGTAVLFRGIALSGWPLFEDDFYRYLFDGYITTATGDPYSLAPSAFFSDATLPENVDVVLSQINFPDIATVYGPVTQWIFAASWWLSPGAIWPFQLAAGIADIAALLILARLCQSSSQRNFLLLYGWSPLLIKDFALTAHPDVYAIALGLLALLLLQKKYWRMCGITIALAIGAKVFAILLIPLMLVFTRSWRGSAHLLAGCVVGLILITLTFGTPTIWFPEGLGAMARHWIFNAPVYRAFQGLVPLSVLKAIALLVLSMVIMLQLMNLWILNDKACTQSIIYKGCLWIFASLMICLPALNPWYLCWLLPFAVLWPSRWPFVWSALVLLAYYTGINVGGSELHQVPTTLIAIQFFGVLAAIIFDWRYPISRTRDQLSNS